MFRGCQSIASVASYARALYRHRNTVLTALFPQGNKCQIVTKNTTIVEVTVSFLLL